MYAGFQQKSVKAWWESVGHMEVAVKSIVYFVIICELCATTLLQE